MATLDDEIDALYRLSPGEFVSARNALAKRAGDRAAEVKALVKPGAAAWAVNQLYWQRRPVFDALAKASEARRAAHVAQLDGRRADLALADSRHRAALDAALAAATTLLRDAGDTVSAATTDALVRTLEAVPSSDVRGRLTRPVEPAGFSAFAALVSGPRGDRPSRPPADVVVMKPRGTAKKSTADGAGDRRAAAAARRAADARARERRRIEKDVAAARDRERDAAAELTTATRETEHAAARVSKLEKELDSARAALFDSRERAERARIAVNTTAASRVALERTLQEMDE